MHPFTFTSVERLALSITPLTYKLFKSACKISQSDLFFNVLNILVSSANIFTLLYTLSGI